MLLKKYINADDFITAGLYALVGECEKHDGFSTAVELDASMNAVKHMPSIYTYEEDGIKALLSVFAPMREEIELSVLVHPDYRNRGIFSALVKEAVNECSCFGYGRGLFVCASEAGRRVMEHWRLVIDHVELQMSCNIDDVEIPESTSLEITEAQESDIESLTSVGAAAFSADADSEREFFKSALAAGNRTQYIAKKDGHAVGVCAACQNGESLMIYGLGVCPDERRKGYAQAMLTHIKREAIKRGIFKLGLDVDEDNPAALKLYRSFGFAVTGRTEYYSFDFKDFI